jgi:hypothetical protein
MTWSYSRLTAYEKCKYCWLLKYIKKCNKKNKFFAQYGLFLHEILQKYLTGETKKQELKDYYLDNFQNNITAKAPNFKVFNNYFHQGLQYLENIEFPHTNIIGIEDEVKFKIGCDNYIGYIDVKSENHGDIVITDHKSKELKCRSNKQVKSDDELDRYLRQLYLYSIAVYDKYQKYPRWLEFNCFRVQRYIVEEFDLEKLNETKGWATNLIYEITNNSEWTPNYSYWYCKYLCDVSDECYVMQLNKTS